MSGRVQDRFDDGAQRVIESAREEALRFNHNYIGTEHLLLGLLRESQGIGARALTSLGVELTRVRTAVEFIIGRGERQVLGDIGVTPRAKKVFDLALDEAHRLGHEYVGTEHILLGLIREGEGIAAGVLESLGVSLEAMRETVMKLLATESGPPPRPVARAPGAWRYLAVPVVETESRAYVVPSYGDKPAILADLVGHPIEEATERLAREGWSLAATDPTFQPREGAGLLYIFKRPGKDRS